MDHRVNTPGLHEESESGPARDILVVDDDAANLTAIEVALGDLERRLVTARSGREALRCLLHRDFALILLDVQMPGMDGFETAELIRSRGRNAHVPIIFITANTRDDLDVLRGYSLGAVDFLFKPIVPEVLKAKASVFVTLQDRKSEIVRQTEQLRAMERREAARKLQEERQRWEADQLREESRRKDEFLAILAHELRNPLASIVGGLGLMSELGLPSERFVESHRSMTRQAKQLTRLVDDLLDVSRISRGKVAMNMMEFDLRDAAQSAADTHQFVVGEREQSFSYEGPSESAYVEGDPVRLTQVMSNLIHNAVRYTPEGGNIRAELKVDGDHVVFKVSDDGRGISSEQLDRIFDLFAQETPGGSGLGLGLTVASRIVELHGGEIQASSEGPGKGSEFEVRLPRVIAPKRPAQITPLPLSVGESDSPLRIALIDDDGDVRSLLKSLLEAWGHDVEIAEDGERGVELVTKFCPDVVLMDVGMPGMNGYEAAMKIREEMKDGTPKLIAMTGYGGPADRKRAEEAGFDEHLVKPAYPDDLLAVLPRGRA